MKDKNDAKGLCYERFTGLTTKKGTQIKSDLLSEKGMEAENGRV